MFDPINVLTLVVAIVAVMATGYAYFRSSAVKVWEQNANAYQARVELLESQNALLASQVAALEARIHELEARPDWRAVLSELKASEARVIAEIRSILENSLRDSEARAAAIAADLALRRNWRRAAR